jgi:hypothetical protein
MAFRPLSCASLCHLAVCAALGVAITQSLGGCGGAVASTSAAPDGGAAQGAPSATTGTSDTRGPVDASSVDRGPPDGGVCVVIDTSSFDSSCVEDTDCVPASVGKLCSGGNSCMCGAATINASEQERYEAYAAKLRSQVTAGPRPCGCPFFGTPRCAQGQCVLCGGASGACTDGG